MGNNYFSPNHSWFLPQFENHCAGQLTVNAELNSKPLIQWDLVALSKNEIQCLLKHSPEWKSQELITSEILTLKVSGLLVFLREVLLPVLSCTVWEELLNRSSHLNKEWKQQNFILLSSAVTAVSMAKQNESWIIIHYSQIMPVEGAETPCSSSSQDASQGFLAKSQKGAGGRNPPVKAATKPVKAPTLCSFCKFILPWEQSQLPGCQWRSWNCIVFHKSAWAHNREGTPQQEHSGKASRLPAPTPLGPKHPLHGTAEILE